MKRETCKLDSLVLGVVESVSNKESLSQERGTNLGMGVRACVESLGNMRVAVEDSARDFRVTFKNVIAFVTSSRVGLEDKRRPGLLES